MAWHDSKSVLSAHSQAWTHVGAQRRRVARRFVPLKMLTDCRLKSMKEQTNNESTPKPARKAAPSHVSVILPTHPRHAAMPSELWLGQEACDQKPLASLGLRRAGWDQESTTSLPSAPAENLKADVETGPHHRKASCGRSLKTQGDPA